MHYQQCVKRLQPFGLQQKITGDQQMVKNGFYYEVWGDNEKADYPSNSTWLQRNTTHSNHRERKIFRFPEWTQQFRDMKN
jgi:hypothetical protein